MCELATAAAIASAVAATAGTVATVQNNNAAVGAQNAANREAAERSRAARDAERMRQQEYSREAMDNWENSFERSAPQSYEDDLAANASRVTQTAEQTQAENPLDVGTLPGQARMSAETQADAARAAADTAARTRQRVQALANLSGYDLTNAGQARDNRGFESDLRLLNSVRRESLGVAQQEGASIAPNVNLDNSLASALTGAGNLGLMYSAQGGFGGGQGGSPGFLHGKFGAGTGGTK
jgi:hypothetical protein